MLEMQKSLKLLLWSCLALLALQRGMGAKCGGKSNAPTVRQRQEIGGGGGGTKFRVEIRNNCPTCPVINLHLRCKGFTQSAVDPSVLRLVSSSSRGDCVANDGLPLGPFQAFSFSYTHSLPFPLFPSSWSFQCE
ncbi:PREDICTED: uncharacterized protein At1g05835 [Tarenaya hassleriana]|uniref:uncharacterized protein At1g05835 n=1 Tax=Tarenaya hassleriana TaxID=28532 RepID=UPI00053C3803|nr:PREDICTED: uncharacterized protein At1g05835 [Tarenaya hassleriana]